MANTTAYSRFRTQTYRLAWLLAFCVLADVILMWLSTGHDMSAVLAKVGIGLFFAACLFSVLARRFTPFVVALGGLILVVASTYG